MNSFEISVLVLLVLFIGVVYYKLTPEKTQPIAQPVVQPVVQPIVQPVVREEIVNPGWGGWRNFGWGRRWGWRRW